MCVWPEVRTFALFEGVCLSAKLSLAFLFPLPCIQCHCKSLNSLSRWLSEWIDSIILRPNFKPALDKKQSCVFWAMFFELFLCALLIISRQIAAKCLHNNIGRKAKGVKWACAGINSTYQLFASLKMLLRVFARAYLLMQGQTAQYDHLRVPCAQHATSALELEQTGASAPQSSSFIIIWYVYIIDMFSLVVCPDQMNHFEQSCRFCVSLAHQCTHTHTHARTQDPRYMATVPMDSSKVIVLDIR